MMPIPLHRFQNHSTDGLPLELLSLDRLPEKALLPAPNRHTFHELFWVTAGRGKHVIDFVEHDIRPNSLFFVKQGRVHYWQIDQPLQGFVLLFQPDLLFTIDNSNAFSQLDLIQTVSTMPCIYTTAVEANWFQETWQRIDHEYNRKHFGRGHAILALLRLVLIEAARLVILEPEVSPVPSASVELAYQYQKLVEKKAIQQHKVEQYADELGITVAHLSQCVKEVTGTAAGEILRRQIVLEAKRLLAFSNATASTVAHELNFADASYFGRFFKRETGHTPRAFRSQLPFKT